MKTIVILSLLVLIGLTSLTPNYFSESNVVLSSAILNTAFAQDNADATTKYLPYENQKYGFSLEYPSSWTYKEINSSTSDELVDFIAADTHVIISRSTNNDFTNLSDKQYLDKMLKMNEDACNNSKPEIICSDFQPLMSTVDSTGKYLSYTLGYTYSEKSTSKVTEKSRLIIQIPDRNYVWRISVSSTVDDLPNHLEEIASTLNSFTIIAELKDTTMKTESKPVTSTPMTPSTSEKKGGGCLIATATYGSELAPQVQQLRELRDNQLLQTSSGSAFMSGFNQFYYSFSPTVADWERENPAFKELVKITLTPMLSSLALLNNADMDSDSSVLAYGISLIMLNVGMYFVAPAITIRIIKNKLK